MKHALTVVACLWAVVFVAIYIALTRRPPNEGPAWWYVGLVLVGVLVAASTLTGARPRVPLGIATGLFGIAILLGVLSIGLLLVPAPVLTAIGAITARSRTEHPEPPRAASELHDD